MVGIFSTCMKLVLCALEQSETYLHIHALHFHCVSVDASVISQARRVGVCIRVMLTVS